MLLRNSLFLGILTFCVVVIEAQNVYVHHFKIASWNTNGDRWKSVKRPMDQEHIDVLGVQEAGKMPTPSPTMTTMRTTTRTPPTISPKIYIIGHLSGQFQEDECPMNGLGLSEFMLENTYYVYYYDRSSCVPGQSTTKKQNIAIVSKTRASEVVIFPPETRRNSVDMCQAQCDERIFINRPTIGIKIGNSFFFTLHTEPKVRNEAELVINQINQYMTQLHPQMTWILMGDFNRSPDTLRSVIPKLTYSMGPKIISPEQGTRGSNVLDFGIVGGPDQQPQ